MILGIYHPAEGIGHDTGVALVREDGSVVAAQSEERFSRVKMDGGFPYRAFESLQRMTGLAPADLAAVAVPFLSTYDGAREGTHLLMASLSDPLLATAQVRNRLKGDRFQTRMAAIGAYRHVPEYRRAVQEVRARDGRPNLADWRGFLRYCKLDGVPLVQVDHHVAHAAGAYFTSGWEDALLVTCDGVGALKSGLVATGRNGRIDAVARTFYPHSTGEFWEAITAICGFHHFKHGGKITGLAAYGNPQAQCYGVMADIIRTNGLTVKTAIDPVAIMERLKGVAIEDIAATAQRRLEEVVTELVQHAVRTTNLSRVALSGGVFANVKVNQRIAQLDDVEEVYVYPAMGDEGLGLGAALYAAGAKWRGRPFRFADVYLGPDYTEREMEAALKTEKLTYSRYEEAELAGRVADMLAAGKVVALFRGRMEFGPRALGHRTILYQTTDATVNDWLNKRLQRTEFMPFAPVTLEEHADECYVGLDKCRNAARFMTITCNCTPWMKRISPAVVHVDGTARPQLIGPGDDPFYYDVLSRYYRATGIPSLINTSFNMHEEPIVCSPHDAIRAFQQGNLDALAIGPFMVCHAEEQTEKRAGS